MIAGLENFNFIKVDTACKHCQYFKNEKCNNKEDCFWKILEKELQRLEAIDNSNPSEALKCLYTIKEEKCREYNSIGVIYYHECVTIQQALIKAEEQKEMEKFYSEICEKLRVDNSLLKDLNTEYKRVLKIIFEKRVDIELLKECEDRCEYNMHFPYREIYHLTQEEFDTLKRC